MMFCIPLTIQDRGESSRAKGARLRSALASELSFLFCRARKKSVQNRCNEQEATLVSMLE